MRPGLVSIINKALSRKPEKRYRSAQAFQRALDAFVVKEGLRVSDFDVAEYVRNHFGDKERVESRALELESRRPSPGRPFTCRSRKSRWALAAGAAAIIGVGAWLGYERLTASAPAKASTAELEPPKAKPSSSLAQPTAVVAQDSPEKGSETPAPASESDTPVAEPIAQKRSPKEPSKRGKRTARPAKKETPGQERDAG